MSGWQDLRDGRDRPEPRYPRSNVIAWPQRRSSEVRDFRTTDREFSAHPASRLYRGYLNPDYTVHSLGKDPPAIKFPRHNGKNGSVIEPISYSAACDALSNSARLTGGGHDNEGFVSSRNILNEINDAGGKGNPMKNPARAPAKIILSRTPSDAATLRRTQRLAVDISLLRVTYGFGGRATEVLKCIDLALPEGKIYGLLGPSGCGKTTLLRCIVGRRSPQGGQVKVFDQVPGSPGAFIPGPGVGYMPQELTLYPEFTIYETLQFFGKVFRMSPQVIEDRIEFLLKFLDLPDQKRLVKNLSGGQKRRVSLAAALIHKPPLLILDEPTVGVDPLLRQAIWNYLVTLTREEGMTVIVTTHYIEEARQANIVGLMRSGRMLAQDEPERLLEDFNCNNLEEVFLQLCLADKEGRAIVKQKKLNKVVTGELNEPSEIKDPSDRGSSKEKAPIYEAPLDVKRAMPPSTKPRFSQRFVNPNAVCGFQSEKKRHDSFTDSVCRVLALVLKNVTRLKRNIPVLLFTFLVPSFQVILFCLCIGADPYDLPVAVVNLDETPTHSSEFLGMISNYTIKQRQYADLENAIASVEHGETWGVIHFRQNYSMALEYRVLYGFSADRETIEESTVDLYMDMTNQQIGFIIQKTILESFYEFCLSSLVKMGKDADLLLPPVRVRDPIYGNGKPSFTEFMAPGIILSITYIMAVGLTAISIIIEFREGTMERCWVAGVRPFEVVVSHVFSQFCVMVVQVSLVLTFMFLVFEIPLEGSIFLVICLTLLQGLTGMTYGLVISSICSDEQSAMMLALGTFYPNLLLSGVIWPVQSMPWYVRYISYGLPQTIPTESLRCIIYRGWDLTHDEVWAGFLISLGWTTIFLLFATAAFKAKS